MALPSLPSRGAASRPSTAKTIGAAEGRDVTDGPGVAYEGRDVADEGLASVPRTACDASAAADAAARPAANACAMTSFRHASLQQV